MGWDGAPTPIGSYSLQGWDDAPTPTGLEFSHSPTTAPQARVLAPQECDPRKTEGTKSIEGANMDHTRRRCPSIGGVGPRQTKPRVF